MLIAILDFLYLGSFFSIVCIFLSMYLLGFALFTLLKKPTNNAFAFAIPMTLISWLALNAAPIPPVAQENLKMMLIQQAKYGIGSNALVNNIIMPCRDHHRLFVLCHGGDTGQCQYTHQRKPARQSFFSWEISGPGTIRRCPLVL